MKITIDTNPLVRLIVRDDKQQAIAAQRAVERATNVMITLPCLCELVWVLRSVYRFARLDVVSVLEELMQIPNAVVDRSAVLAGLEVLRSGGDFADGVIAYEGRRLGSDVFLSFDRKAVRLVQAQGYGAELI
jgi:predicted nucleic-acid-binding protein